MHGSSPNCLQLALQCPFTGPKRTQSCSSMTMPVCTKSAPFRHVKVGPGCSERAGASGTEPCPQPLWELLIWTGTPTQLSRPPHLTCPCGWMNTIPHSQAPRSIGKPLQEIGAYYTPEGGQYGMGMYEYIWWSGVHVCSAIQCTMDVDADICGTKQTLLRIVSLRYSRH